MKLTQILTEERIVVHNLNEWRSQVLQRYPKAVLSHSGDHDEYQATIRSFKPEPHLPPTQGGQVGYWDGQEGYVITPSEFYAGIE